MLPSASALACRRAERAIPSSLQREGLEQLRVYEAEFERRCTIEHEYAMFADWLRARPDRIYPPSLTLLREDDRSKGRSRRRSARSDPDCVPCRPIVSHPPTQCDLAFAMVALLLRRAPTAAVARSTGRYPPCNKMYHI